LQILLFKRCMVGLDRLELSTSRLSGARSNHLSYRPCLTYIKYIKNRQIVNLGRRCNIHNFLQHLIFFVTLADNDLLKYYSFMAIQYMIKKFSLIASIISAITAITTSIRGLARSREYPAHDIEALKSSARLSGIRTEQGRPSNNIFFIYSLSTLIWFLLSIIFAIPIYIRFWSDKDPLGIFIWISSFIVLAVVLLTIWRKINISAKFT
jgi:hypothetical protein